MNRVFTVSEQGCPRKKIGTVKADTVDNALEKIRKKFKGAGGIHVVYQLFTGETTNFSTNV